MTRNDYIAAFILVVVVVGIIIGAARWIHVTSVNACRGLSERIGYNTQFTGSVCLIEIRPNLWVSEYSIAEHLPLIDCR